MTEPILDPAIWASLRALDDDGAFLDEVIDLFIDDARPRVERVRAGLAGGDPQAARTAAHSLRGSAGNIGATAVAAMARDIEHDLDAGKPVAPAAVDALAAALDQAIQALSAERSRPRE
jgi:HPt (histidine-containing phosphotransfer) domain-containing protein